MAQLGFKLFLFDSVTWNSECGDGNCTRPVNICTPRAEDQQLIQFATKAGIAVGVYTRNPNCWSNGLKGLGNQLSQVKFFIIDIESQPGIAPTQAMVQGVQALGIQPVMYSSSGMWPGITKNLTAFANLPLQDTNVTGGVTLANWKPSLLTPAPISFGGWNVKDSSSSSGYKNLRIGIQQAFNITISGQSVDLDSFDGNWLAGLK